MGNNIPENGVSCFDPPWSALYVSQKTGENQHQPNMGNKTSILFQTVRSNINPGSNSGHARMQIMHAYNLPRIPLKRTDTRLAWFMETFNIDYGVEIDALPPDILRQNIEDSILDNLDADEINRKIEEDNQAKLDILGVLEDNS